MPASLVLAANEMDENHLTKFSFRTREGFLLVSLFLKLRFCLTEHFKAMFSLRKSLFGLAQWLKTLLLGEIVSELNSWASQIRRFQAARHLKCFLGAVLSRRWATEMDPATRYTLQRDTASIMQIFLFCFNLNVYCLNNLNKIRDLNYKKLFNDNLDENAKSLFFIRLR